MAGAKIPRWVVVARILSQNVLPAALAVGGRGLLVQELNKDRTFDFPARNPIVMR